jgi:hypothetical protein
MTIIFNQREHREHGGKSEAMVASADSLRWVAKKFR